MWYDRKEEINYDAPAEREGINETLETILKIVAELEHEVGTFYLFSGGG